MTYETLKTIFEGKYLGKKEIFSQLISEIFNKAKDLTASDTDYSQESDNTKIKSCTIFAQVGGAFPITFADVELKENISVKTNRVAVQACVRRILENHTNAIIFFHQAESTEWRISYVHRGSSNKDSTNAKRFTYLCGEGHACKTVCERFLMLSQAPRIDDEAMLKAFSVATLSDEFFNEYKVFYEDFVQFITGCRYVKSSGNKNKWEKRKIHEPNNVIFPQFESIAQKELLTSDTSVIVPHAQKLVRDYIKKLMGRLIFLQFLQKKGWLGVPQNGQWGAGDKNYLQNLFAHSEYKEDFLDKVLEKLFFDTLNVKRDADICEKILGDNVKIPYLNGGLFEKDLFFDSTNIQFPKEFFSNPEKKDIERKFAGEKEVYPYTESSGILDFFGRYNFTIDETDPYEQEIGVDPEMLGKIFENLLEDNKDKGAFYTPKEIVQYMCRESLIAYLVTDSHIEEERIRQFVLTHKDDFTETEKKMLSHKLQSVKICDPAVGSGAFPMGILNELYACRHVIEQDEDAVEIKKQIVRDNIYGVDIEKGAVDIARLRFWLAIIVDETAPLPLPNLDYKIMQGNSLLESFEGIDLSNLLKRDGELFDDDEIIKHLVCAIDGFYMPNDQIAKAKIRKQISEKVIQLLKERQLAPATIKKLEAMDLHANSEFFLWHTWFNDVFNRPNDCNGGFDIVIGNPPYVFARDSKEKGITPKLKKIYYQNFELAKYQLNLYHLFIELGTRILRRNGIFSYIVPNNWLTINTNKELRRFILEKSEITIVNFLKKNFENADVDSSIIIFKNNQEKRSLVQFFEAKTKEKFDRIKKIETSFFFSQKDFIINIELFNNDASAIILNQIEQNSKYLQDIAEVKSGLKAYEVGKGIPPLSNEMKEKRVYHSTIQKDKDWMKYLKGVDVCRYLLNWSGEYLKYGKNLAAPRSFNLYSTPRILVRQIPSKLPYCINAMFTEEIYLNDLNSMNIIELKEAPKYVLGILNSKAISFWFANKLGKLQRGLFPQFKIKELATFPIPAATPEQQKAMISLVDKILTAKKEKPQADTSALEHQIDLLVYHLYGLTFEEAKIIDENLTEEEFNITLI